MLIHAGLNTHSNRISTKELKEDGKDSSIVRKIQSVAACSTMQLSRRAPCSCKGVLQICGYHFPFALVKRLLQYAKIFLGIH
ncbi:hypothetical protein GFB69_12235 [Acidianus ambivalens]|uniref:Uncharacterized protein n=1 Tax=Acidianus ambivalens TaxID=2283 RepID=A0A650CTA4_ACIAM|nr:hypothetical protein [Acidianus ambivalens]QGR21084.1 hypothetical protein D1866_02890 [Acidianus ambivalens]